MRSGVVSVCKCWSMRTKWIKGEKSKPSSSKIQILRITDVISNRINAIARSSKRSRARVSGRNSLPDILFASRLSLLFASASTILSFDTHGWRDTHNYGFAYKNKSSKIDFRVSSSSGGRFQCRRINTKSHFVYSFSDDRHIFDLRVTLNFRIEEKNSHWSWAWESETHRQTRFRCHIDIVSFDWTASIQSQLDYSLALCRMGLNAIAKTRIFRLCIYSRWQWCSREFRTIGRTFVDRWQLDNVWLLYVSAVSQQHKYAVRQRARAYIEILFPLNFV